MTRLQGSPSTVWHYLSTFANNEGECWPKIDTIAADLGLHDRTVQRALKALEDGGALVIKRQYGENGAQVSNRYFLIFADPEVSQYQGPLPFSDQAPTPVTPVSPSPGTAATLPRPESHPPGDAGATPFNKESTGPNELNQTPSEEKSPTGSKRKAPPTEARPSSREAVCEMAEERGVDIEVAEDFCDHFDSNGWKVSGRTPMKDWRAAFSRWIREELKRKPKPSKPQNVAEVLLLAQKMGEKPVRASEFWDHYEASGWKSGGGEQIADWQAAFRNWCRKAPLFERKVGGGSVGSKNLPIDEWKFGSKPIDRLHYWMRVEAQGAVLYVLGPPNWPREKRYTKLRFNERLFHDCKEQGREWWAAMGLELEIEEAA